MLPLVVHAQSGAVAEANAFVEKLTDYILSPLVSVMMAVALLLFLWGCFQYIYGAADSGARDQGRKHIIWGVVGFVVMVSAYGILRIATNTIGV